MDDEMSISERARAMGVEPRPLDEVLDEHGVPSADIEVFVRRLSPSEQVMALAMSGRPYGTTPMGSTHCESRVVARLIAAGYEIVKVGTA